MDRKRIRDMYDIKRFFIILYKPVIGSGGNLIENQHIRIFQQNSEASKVKYFNNIDDLVRFATSKQVYNYNTYFTLSTTNGEGGTLEDLMIRTCIGFDFDKKTLGSDFNHKDIVNRFNSLNLWFHALVDSGNGYHAYMAVEPTSDIERIVEVTKAIGKRLGADPHATKATQILRMPFSYNIKDTKRHKCVNLIHFFDPRTVRRYDIERLYNRFCGFEKYKDNKTVQYTISNINLPPCIENILSEGSQESTRYFDLQNIVVVLRERNRTLTQIQQICKEWGHKS
ncbi:MAG: hypothetical protein GX352_03270, partial [Clostridiales bacterium]|nr:hypothetical protein [Clostridiales bacterium]